MARVSSKGGLSVIALHTKWRGDPLGPSMLIVDMPFEVGGCIERLGAARKLTASLKKVNSRGKILSEMEVMRETDLALMIGGGGGARHVGL